MKKFILLFIAVVISRMAFAQKHDLYSTKKPRDVYEMTKTAIAKEMLQWQTKGEFEKKVDYEKRIADKSKQIFDSIVVVQMLNSMRYETDWYCYPMQYDVENETFEIKFINEDVTLSYTMDIKMDVEFAKKVRMFTDEFDRRHPEWGYQGIEEYVAVNLVDDWKDVLLLKGHFLFKKIIMKLKDESKLVFEFPVPDTEPVIFHCDDMELNNPYLEGYSCEFSQIYDQWKAKNRKK